MLTSLSNGTIFGEIEGQSKKGVVFLHGWGRSRADFSVIAEKAVAAGFMAARLDLPGFGATPPPETGEGTIWYSKAVADAIRDLVCKYGIEEVAVVGHSFGGRIAVQLAKGIAKESLTLGASCVGFIISGVPLFRPEGKKGPSLGLRTLKFLVRMRMLPYSRLEKYRSNHGSLDYRRAEGVMRETFVKVVNEDYSEQLASIEGIPFVFYWGQDDTAAPLSHAQRGVEMVDMGRLIVVRGDHFTFLSEADDVVKELHGLFAK
ncbi:MAG: alpha/beta fold hydrolase [Actinomycetota bacterium]|nr:alpha/beta fold hydrolase [Actinomycetota bacterium]